MTSMDWQWVIACSGVSVACLVGTAYALYWKERAEKAEARVKELEGRR